MGTMPCNKASVGLWLLALLVMASSGPSGATAQDYDWKWKTGRATYYGTDDWSIHKGGCNYGYLYKDEPLGWDVAALSDYHPDYAESCGICYEVKCDKSWIGDNYGGKFDRSYSCYDDSTSLVVRITDVCPCTYPANGYSNKRWCCGDADHFDLSIWAFEKLADVKWGVIGLQYRRVPCDYKPDKQAPKANYPSPWYGSEPGGSRPRRDWPEYQWGAQRSFAFYDGISAGWWDNSWNTWVQPWQESQQAGMRGGPALCGKISSKGALSLKTHSGAFKDKYKLEFWAYVGVGGWEGTSAKKPDININISGNKGACTPRRIYDVQPDAYEPRSQYAADYYWRWVYYLPYFNGADTREKYSNKGDFGGCGGNAPEDLTTIEFRNDGWGDKWVCLDRISLM